MDWINILNLIVQAFISLVFGALGAVVVNRLNRKQELERERRIREEERRKMFLGQGGIAPKSEAEAAWQAKREGRNIISISSFFVIFLLGVMIFSLFRAQSISFITIPATATTTATAIPFARIESLDVIQDGSIIETITPGRKITLTAESNVSFKVNVISNLGLDNFVFIWEFCDPSRNVTGQGAKEIPYRTSTVGADCQISVKIKEGTEFLDNAHFLVEIR